MFVVLRKLLIHVRRFYPLSPGDHAPEKLTKAIDTSFKKLGGKFRVFYLHAPDRSVDWTEMCRAINEAHKAGKL